MGPAGIMRLKGWLGTKKPLMGKGAENRRTEALGTKQRRKSTISGDGKAMPLRRYAKDPL